VFDKSVNRLSFEEYSLPIRVFDFFAGCGGSCKGFQKAGLDIIFALDKDQDSALTFEHNFKGTSLVNLDLKKLPKPPIYLLEGIKSVSTEFIEPLIRNCRGYPVLFSASAPCQPFTKQNTIKPENDKRSNLLGQFQRFVEAYLPEYIFIENVPGMQYVGEKKGPFKEFVRSISEIGYDFEYKVVAAGSYGVPQTRRRLILIASRLGPISFPLPTHGTGTPNPEYATVREWIQNYPPIKAGEAHPDIPNHRAANLSETNLERIRSISEGQGREDWPDRLKLDCHKNGYTGHTDVYGRMFWDARASGLTTRCISLSNGRFGHPEQDRAISVREAASLQTFPRDFVFLGSLTSMARQVGNALPVLLAQRFAENFNCHFKNTRDITNG
jgi:DNA (cytosine-5)-methyltransferase 1